MSNAEVLADIVRDAGYIAVVEGSLVLFKVEGTNYQFETFVNDPDFARLMLGFRIPVDADINRLLTLANEQNGTTKALKTLVNQNASGGYIWFTVEMFFDEAKAWGPIFSRALALLRTKSEDFSESLKSEDVA